MLFYVFLQFSCIFAVRLAAFVQISVKSTPAHSHHLAQHSDGIGLLLLPDKNDGTEDIFDGVDSKVARKCCPKSLWSVARRKMDQLNRVRELNELNIPPGNRLERLKGDRKNQFSIRINQQYRICFVWEEGYAYEVEITDYH